MIDAAAIGRQIAAAVHRQNLQFGMALDHAVEDQMVERDGGLERISDHVVEIEARQALRLREAIGMYDDEGAELFGLLPERGIFRLRDFPAGDVGQNLRTDRKSVV